MIDIPQEVCDKAARIRLLIFDVDGVLTDGSLYYDDEGREYKAFHSRDGHGMKMLMASGVNIAIITSRSAPAVSHRMANLGITAVYQGQQEKLPAFEALLNDYSLTADQAAFVGDDVVDLPVMLRAGLAIAAHDSHWLVKQYAHWSTPCPAGHGAARDACEMIMASQGNLEAQFARYLKA